jgi:hypothetical protein
VIVRKAGGIGLSLEAALELTADQVNWLLDTGGDSVVDAEQSMMDKRFVWLDELTRRVGRLDGVPVGEISERLPATIDPGELAFTVAEFIRCTTETR